MLKIFTSNTTCIIYDEYMTYIDMNENTVTQKYLAQAPAMFDSHMQRTYVHCMAILFIRTGEKI